MDLAINPQSHTQPFTIQDMTHTINAANSENGKAYYFTYPIHGNGGEITLAKKPFVPGTEMQYPVYEDELIKAGIDMSGAEYKRLSWQQAKDIKQHSSWRKNYWM